MNFTVLRLDHLVLRVRDPQRMIAFYRDVLGCPLEKTQAALGLYQLRAGQSLIDLVDVAGPLGRHGGQAPGAEGRNLDHLCLRIEPFDLAQLQAHLVRHGVTPGESGLRYGAEGNGPSLYLTDPEGNLVELKGPPGPQSAGE